MSRTNLDTDVLRTLVAAQQLGGFNRAAAQIGRSQSAVSQQLRKLEEQVGQPLVRKQGRGLAFTEAGEVLLAYARRMLELNDEAVAAVKGIAVDGMVRFGMPGDFAETWLPAVLGRFKRAHPTVRVEATVDRNTSLVERMERGQIDLALTLGLGTRANAEVLTALPMAWIGGRDVPWRRDEPVPLAMFEAPCLFRSAALTALDSAGIPWRIAFTSPSLSGLWAAVDAGLGITVRTAASVPHYLVAPADRFGLPPLPSVELSLHIADAASPAVARLKDILLETLASNLPTAGGIDRNSRARVAS